MSLFEIFYNIIIGPLKYLFEVIFSIGFILSNSAGIGIIFLSFVLNILLLPLYKKADQLQKEEDELQRKMKSDLDFINNTFKGNERFYIIQTYYRQHKYKPIYSLRSSISLLLQIPFFVAAYDFLSNLKELDGVSFLFIYNLGAPDGLLFGINLLPIFMTLINIISTVVYTHGQPIKQKIQLYIMAGLFLLLLYNTPAALSMYYLLNNVFSLIKNVFSKQKNAVKIISAIGIITSILLFFFLYKFRLIFESSSVILIGIIDFVLFIISLFCFRKGNIPEFDLSIIPENNNSFFLCCLLMCVLTGLLIPSSVINASPEEFVDHISLVNPIKYIMQSFLLSIGLFLVWFVIYYLMMDKKHRKVFGLLMWIISFVSIIDYLFFSKNLGTMSNHLVYDSVPSFSTIIKMANLFIISLLSLAVSVIWIKFDKFSKGIVVVIVSFLIMSVLNINNINKSYIQTKNKLEKNVLGEKLFTFSKDNKNVVVFMLDRAISMYYPFLLEEKPELHEQFSGFTFYPNTISFGATTNIGSPSLFGGYEYIPEEMNKRDTELLVDKHNEALKVMPVLFSNNSYETVVCDPPYAGYSWVPDLSIYDEYPDIKSYITIGSFYENEYSGLNVLNQKLFGYSVTRIIPSFLFNLFYNNGSYLFAPDVLNSDLKVNKTAFLDSYQVLERLDELTYIDENGKGLFLMIQNSATHEPLELQEPDYIPADIVDNSDYVENDEHKESIFGETIEVRSREQLKHYHVNMASMLQLGKWFDYLKENGVYDNTRIIIASDHGFSLHLRDDLEFLGGDLLHYNALLLVKDFDSEVFSVDNSFMTLADVPYLATEDIISNPINEITGNPITKKDKEGELFNILVSTDWDVNENNGNTFKKGEWYSVHDNCLDLKNWEIVDDPNER